MSSDSENEDAGGMNLFEDPEGFYLPEKQPSFVEHRLLDGRGLRLRLVGHNPLWVGLTRFLACVVVFFFQSSLLCFFFACFGFFLLGLGHGCIFLASFGSRCLIWCALSLLNR